MRNESGPQISEWVEGAWLGGVKFYRRCGLPKYNKHFSVSAFIMGQEESHLGHVSDGSDFIVVSNSLPKVFQFSPTESRLISYGIDQQTSPKYKDKSLGKIALQDAEQVVQALVTVGAVERENAHIYSSSGDPDHCTANGMKAVFQTRACEVGPNGIFVFHFSGHGISVRHKEWGLAPMDFDYSRDTYITASVLSQWLNEIECKAKYILISLDCCYAGGIGKELAARVQVNRGVDLYVISACTANETSIVLNSLEHSIYTYFLSEYITRLSTEAGILPIGDIFSECQICSGCLSSMLVFYNSETGLQLKFMQPQMDIRNIVMSDGGEDSTDAAIGRFQFAIELYDRKHPTLPLEDKSVAFLDSIQRVPDGPLFELEKRKLLQGNVVIAVLCSMMYSIASIELACDTKLTKVENVNLCITAFMQVASTIDIVHHGVEFSEVIFFKSCMFYTQAMRKNGIKLSGMDTLATKLKKRLTVRSAKYNMARARGEDMTDSIDSGLEDSVSL